METLVVGDVHGCAEELRALYEAAGRPDRVVLVGDLFTKGPDPRGVYETIRSNGWRTVLGNHDARLLKFVQGKSKDKDLKRVARALDGTGREWRAWLAGVPLFEEAGPFTVVHAGIHPSGSLKKTTRTMALNMRRWPKEKSWCPFWWSIYRGSRPIVFGHDARRGLIRVERSGEPLLIGLDTGCVYGGALSGYRVHDDEIVQVAAAEVYQDPG